MAGIHVRPLTPTIGAVIEGVDLSQGVSADLTQAIREALLEHQVIFFEDQHLRPVQDRDVTKPEFQVRFRWSDSALAFWDNRVTQHYAVNDYLPNRRVMNRATVLGDRPFHRSRMPAEARAAAE